jgi:hypothetical protein
MASSDVTTTTSLDDFPIYQKPANYQGGPAIVLERDPWMRVRDFQVHRETRLSYEVRRAFPELPQSWPLAFEPDDVPTSPRVVGLLAAIGIDIGLAGCAHYCEPMGSATTTLRFVSGF